MAGEATKTYAEDFVMTADGPEVIGTNMSPAPSNAIDSANHSDYLYCDIILDVTFSTKPVGTYINIYRWDIGVYNSKDTLSPSVGYKHKFVGSVDIYTGGVDGNPSPQTLILTSVPLSRECKFMFHYPDSPTPETGQPPDSILSGWDLIVRPWTIGPWI